jgi:hypothetical protein
MASYSVLLGRVVGVTVLAILVVCLPWTKVYSLHAREVECIGKGKAHRPYEFGVKVSIATTVSHSAGEQFVTQAAALPGMETLKPKDRKLAKACETRT